MRTPSLDGVRSPGPARSLALLAATVAWLILAASGMGILVRYSLTPGRPGESPAHWPAATALERPAGPYTLVLALHPRCACSRATLSELAAIMTRSQGRLSALVLFVQPRGFGEEWTKSDLWRAAAAIPGVRPLVDPEGREARRFGAFTSGQAALYDARGRLEFSGGITGARAHEGTNAGEISVVSVVGRSGANGAQTPVYGCALEASPSHKGS